MTARQMTVLCCECGTVRNVASGYVGIGSERRLRCSTCRRTTWHGSAVGISDHRERLNARAILRLDDPWAEVEAHRVQVVEVPHLSTPGYWIEDERTLLIRPGLSEQDTDRCVKWALARITGEQRSPWAAIEDRGWQVVEVPGLQDHACLVTDQHVLLVRGGIDQATIDWAVAWALERIGHHHTR